MRRRTRDAFRSIAATIVAVMMALILLPEGAAAQWDDRSDELPGYDISATTIIVAAAVVVGVVLLVRHLTRDDDGDDEATETSARNGGAFDRGAAFLPSTAPAGNPPAPDVPFDLMIGARPEPGGAGSALFLGVRVRVGPGASGMAARK